MTIADLLRPEGVVLDLRAPEKRRLLDDLARRASALAGLEPAAIAEALNRREQLGSTGMGSGIAIPHARLPALAQPVGVFVRLRPALDFDAIDGQRVDLVFLLLLPAEIQGDALNALACVARRLRDEQVASALRKAPKPETAFSILTGPQAP